MSILLYYIDNDIPTSIYGKRLSVGDDSAFHFNNLLIFPLPILVMSEIVNFGSFSPVYA